MKLLLERAKKTDKSILGKLKVDGVFQCFTLENLGKSIPTGTYVVKMEHSPRFDMDTPHLQDVPNRTFIEIHPANKPEDLEGCIGVGRTQTTDWIGESRMAFSELLAKIKNQSITLEITE